MVLADIASSEQGDCNTQERNINDIIQKLRPLVESEKGLICCTTDKFLTRFIKASKYDLEQSHILVKEYFKAKVENPEVFVVQSPLQNIHMLRRYDLGYQLKGVDHSGRTVLYINLGDVDPAKESWISVFQVMIMCLEAFSLEEDIQDSGIALILDVTNFTLKLMKWATPHKLRILMRILQECIPVRFEIFHVVNAPMVFNVFFTALKPFMNEEFKRKLKWHRGDLKTIEQHLDRCILPVSLGGSIEIKDIMNWNQIVLNKEDDFTEIRTMGYKSTDCF
ncbi:clavesin-2-like [Lycorma delicatula]|uniref:clavesin-2-like n=1 Tax=Lycorma delicatula TaxID=130591 RepID=UPI003F512F4B